jgi:prophage regulatory protein
MGPPPAKGCPERVIPVGKPLQILRVQDVEHRTGLSRTSLWRLQRAGDFPPSRRLSPGTVGWLESEVEAWIASRSTKGVGSTQIGLTPSRSRTRPITIPDKVRR